jgi:hypothetical protein
MRMASLRANVIVLSAKCKKRLDESMARADNVMELPPDLPAPQDDGACDHLTGMRVPSIALRSTGGRAVELAKLPGTAVV